MSTEKMDPKKRGRPHVDSEAVKVRIQQPLLGRVDDYAAQAGINRPEAIRRLVERGLNDDLACDLGSSSDRQP